MRLVLMLFTFVALAAGDSIPDPAKLEVTALGDSLSYKVVNQSPYSIAEYEIYTQFTSGGFENLGCGVGAKVKSAKDLSIASSCRLPRDARTGKPVAYTSRIGSVKFENGLTWTPAGR